MVCRDALLMRLFGKTGHESSILSASAIFKERIFIMIVNIIATIWYLMVIVTFYSFMTMSDSELLNIKIKEATKNSASYHRRMVLLVFVLSTIICGRLYGWW